MMAFLGRCRSEKVKNSMGTRAPCGRLRSTVPNACRQRPKRAPGENASREEG
jgi:hypothetical protein